MHVLMNHILKKLFQMKQIKKKAIHPQHGEKTNTPYYDIAVLTLTSPADINRTDGLVRTICLPDKSSDNVDNHEGDQVR